MSTSVQVEPVMERRYGGVGRCKCSFWFAVAHDILGVLIMMVGVFGGLVIHDLFIYAGGIIIFFSLIWWVFWYSGNIDVPPEELEDDVGLIKLKNRGISRVVRRMSSRLSTGIRNSFRRNGQPNREAPRGPQPQEGPTRPSDTGPQTQTDVSLSIIYDNSMISSSSREFVRETLSV
ncbi:transmembrane protein 238-like [Myripristis murdjan]|uniref:transmembrane protein 238-like n=1 Tax=Myripristis murdjan TaxID=586833 RepID=UPI00117603C1|nr:transmembrane protein 238-like [Myripristis murdjan]